MKTAVHPASDVLTTARAIWAFARLLPSASWLCIAAAAYLSMRKPRPDWVAMVVASCASRRGYKSTLAIKGCYATLK
ncbi:hypothetical protein, partial [Caballeronia sp. AAUFL_F1_KS45]|uniref:hypothetical protein n=1 Tax=Caballeronia sp. AAUFL_F1_KS45 TaxID=2921770 RepID=UPI0020283C24